MVMPTYEELTKAAKDTFNRGFPAGLFKLDAKLTSRSGLENKAGMEHNFSPPGESGEGGEGGGSSAAGGGSSAAGGGSSSAVGSSTAGSTTGGSSAAASNAGGGEKKAEKQTKGHIDTMYKFQTWGLSLGGKWDTENDLSIELATTDYITPGLKLALEALVNAESGKAGGKFAGHYKHQYATLVFDVDGYSDGASGLNATIVSGYKGFLAGYQNQFIISEGKMAKNNFSFGWCSGDSMIMGNLDNLGELYGVSIYHRISGRTEAAVELRHVPDPAPEGSEVKPGTVLGIAGRYFLDSATAVKAKVDTEMTFGLGYEQKIREGVTLTLGAQIDGKNFSSGPHKVGLGLEFEA